MQPLVSVIIPNYNHTRFLAQRVDSVLQQTYENFEVILLDDCSTDNSRKILQEYSNHPRVTQLVFNEINSGSPFAQWEKGIQLAKGKYIWIAESDDFCELDFLEKLMPLFEKRENVGLVYCRSTNVDQNGKFNDEYWPDGLDDKKWRFNFCNQGTKEIKDALKYRNTIPNASACIFTKQNFDFTEIKKMLYAGDWLFWTQILLEKDVCFYAEPLNHFRFHDNTTRVSATGKKNYKKYAEYQKVLLYIYKSLDKPFKYDRGHQWIYNDFKRQSLSYWSIYKKLRPFFRTYVTFQIKVLKNKFRKNILKR